MLTWKTINTPAGPNHLGAYSGNTRVLVVTRSLTMQGYDIKTSLPTFPPTVTYETEEDAVVIAENLFQIWLDKTNLMFKEK